LIPYGRQCLSEQDIEAVESVLRSDFLTQGDMVPAFERALCDYTGAGHAVAVSSATAALHLACLVLGVGAGDRVWTSPNTFVASANCALYCGAQVEFVDIDPATGNMSVASLHRQLEVARAACRLPKVVIPVHFAGQSCDMAGIAALGREYGFRVIEDASHALGAENGNVMVGNCRYSDIAVFSFHPVKMITTGEGGALMTNQGELADEARLLRSHGISRQAETFEQLPAEPWCYEQHALGFNYRMNDLEAALGVSQMRQLDQFVSRRRALAGRYRALLEFESGVSMLEGAVEQSSWHLFVVSVPRRDLIFRQMRASGIGVNVHYIPVYRQPYHMPEQPIGDRFAGMESYYSSALTLPLYPELSEEQQDQVVNALTQSLRETGT